MSVLLLALYKKVCYVCKQVCIVKLFSVEILDIKARLTIQTILQHYGLRAERGTY